MIQPPTQMKPQKCVHKNLGDCLYTEACHYMQVRNPDSTTIFIEHEGEIKEVSKSLVSFPGEENYDLYDLGVALDYRDFTSTPP